MPAPPPATKATIVHLARGGGAGINGRHLVNANASLATLLKVFPNASVVERTTHGGETHFCGQLMFDAATVVLTAHGSHVVAALFAPVNTIVLEVMPWDMWTGRGFSYGGANKYLAGTGIARQRQAIMNGLRESVIHFHADVEGINAGQVMEMMMMTQYFDTMKEMGTTKGNNTIFVPSGPGAVADAAASVRMGMMQGAIGADAVRR